MSASATDPDVERELIALAHEFAENEIRPVARHYDETEEFPVEIVRQGGARRASPASICPRPTAAAASTRFAPRV